MTELTLRDGMVIVGSLLILAVAIDAWRRMRQQQRATVRLKLANNIPPDAPAEDLSLYRELPNGGARVVVRDSFAGDTCEADSVPSGDPGADAATDAPASASSGRPLNDAPSASQPAVRKATRRVDPAESQAEPTADRGSASTTLEAEDSIESDDPHAALSGMRAEDDEPANLDWLEDLPATPIEDSEDGVGSLVRDPETEVLVLHVTSRDQQGFAGKDILEILLACDLRFGDMNFFHRHEQPAGRGPIQFSVANMLQPGVFDIDNMEGMRTRGLVFFLTLPGPEDMAQAFDYMLETARAVARNLTGDLLDESRSVLTQQSIEHSKQQIRELERRLLASRA